MDAARQCRRIESTDGTDEPVDRRSSGVPTVRAGVAQTGSQPDVAQSRRVLVAGQCLDEAVEGRVCGPVAETDQCAEAVFVAAGVGRMVVRDGGDVACRQVSAFGDHLANFRVGELEQRSFGRKAAESRVPFRIQYMAVLKTKPQQKSPKPTPSSPTSGNMTGIAKAQRSCARAWPARRR